MSEEELCVLLHLRWPQIRWIRWTPRLIEVVTKRINGWVITPWVPYSVLRHNDLGEPVIRISRAGGYPWCATIPIKEWETVVGVWKGKK